MIGVRTHRRKLLLGQTAVTYLALGVWAGPDRALLLVLVVALLAGWLALCRRYPVVAWTTVGFIRGLCGR